MDPEQVQDLANNKAVIGGLEASMDKVITPATSQVISINGVTTNTDSKTKKMTTDVDVEMLFSLLVKCDDNCDVAIEDSTRSMEDSIASLTDSVESGNFTETLEETGEEFGLLSLFSGMSVVQDSLVIEDIVVTTTEPTDETTTEPTDEIANEPTNEPTTKPSTEPTTKPATSLEIIMTLFSSLLAILVEAFTFFFIPSF